MDLNKRIQRDLNEVYRENDTLGNMPDADKILHYVELNKKTWGPFKQPAALGMRGWRLWRATLKSEFPYRYQFFYEIPRAVSLWFRVRVEKLNRFKWAMYHRYHPKHQYNVIRIKSLPPGYYDPDIRILHACMDEIAEYARHCLGTEEYDQKLLDEAAEYEKDHLLYQKQKNDEVRAIVHWWTNVYPRREEDLDAKYPLPKSVNDKDSDFDAWMDEINSPEHRDVWKLRREEEDRWHQEDDEMLIRLMKIRRSLWYP